MATTPMYFERPRDLLSKAARELDRLDAATEAADKIASADHAFNLSITLLSIRDWVIKEKPEIRQAVLELYRGAAFSRIADFANVSKHRELTRRYSEPALGPATLSALVGPPRWETEMQTETETVIIGYVPKLTLIDGQRFDLRVECERAIHALDWFMRNNGL